MIIQETKQVKSWGGFYLTILKVNLNPLSWKNWSSYNKNYKPPHSTSYCYLPVELTDTITCKLRIHRLIFSWIHHQIQSTLACVSLGFNVKESSSKISQEIHTNRNLSNTKTWLEFAFYTWGKLENPKHFK